MPGPAPDQQAAAFWRRRGDPLDRDRGQQSLLLAGRSDTRPLRGRAGDQRRLPPLDRLAGGDRRDRARHPRRGRELPGLRSLDCRADRIGASGPVDRGHGGSDVAAQQSATCRQSASGIGVGVSSRPCLPRPKPGCHFRHSRTWDHQATNSSPSGTETLSHAALDVNPGSLSRPGAVAEQVC
jgi:hypothetical protein